MATAQLILTGYDRAGLQKSLEIIEANTKRLNLKMRKNPPLKGRVKPKSKLWGIDKDARQKVADLTGEMDDLRRIFDLKIVRGIYLQMLLKKG